MVRRANLETRTNHERWLVSYADFVTLLFAFFVVMYSVSQVSEVKYRKLAQTLDTVFDNQIVDTLGNSEIADQSPQMQQSERYSLANMAQLKQQLTSIIADAKLSDLVSVSGNENWLEIQLESEMIFASGAADIAPDVKPLFNQLSDILQPFDNAIAVIGHTDNVPINNQKYANNWQLSAARAVSVVNYLSFQGVDPTRLSAIGRSSFQPIADNHSPEGRRHNRRVVFRVENKVNLPSGVKSAVSLSSESALGGEVQPPVAALNTSNDANLPQPTASSSLPVVQPVRLKNGGLLFSSDPNLPRNNR